MCVSVKEYDRREKREMEMELAAILRETFPAKGREKKKLTFNDIFLHMRVTYLSFVADTRALIFMEGVDMHISLHIIFHVSHLPSPIFDLKCVSKVIKKVVEMRTLRRAVAELNIDGLVCSILQLSKYKGLWHRASWKSEWLASSSHDGAARHQQQSVALLMRINLVEFGWKIE